MRGGESRCLQTVKLCVGAKKGGAKQELSWLDVLRHKSEQAKQRRKPEATPSQIAGMTCFCKHVWATNHVALVTPSILSAACPHAFLFCKLFPRSELPLY